MGIRLAASDEAKDLADRVKDANPAAELAFMLDDGCCENSGLQLQQLWWKDPNNLLLGEIEGIPVYCPRNVGRILDNSVINVDVVSSDDMVDSFSIETAFGCRFSTRIKADARQQAG